MMADTFQPREGHSSNPVRLSDYRRCAIQRDARALAEQTGMGELQALRVLQGEVFMRQATATRQVLRLRFPARIDGGQG